MKKIQLIVLFTISILLFSCSKDDNDTNLTSSGFNPPSWIIGSWLEESGQSYSTSGYKFTKDNFIELNSEGEEILNYGVFLGTSIKQGVAIIEETKTSDTYKVKVILNGITTLNFKFTLISNTTLGMELIGYTSTIVLTKQ